MFQRNFIHVIALTVSLCCAQLGLVKKNDTDDQNATFSHGVKSKVLLEVLVYARRCCSALSCTPHGNVPKHSLASDSESTPVTTSFEVLQTRCVLQHGTNARLKTVHHTQTSRKEQASKSKSNACTPHCAMNQWNGK